MSIGKPFKINQEAVDRIDADLRRIEAVLTDDKQTAAMIAKHVKLSVGRTARLLRQLAETYRAEYTQVGQIKNRIGYWSRVNRTSL